jgi:uncharacterized protein YndB with AHSA1/START domain
MTTSTASIVLDEFYPHAIETVWRALTDRKAIEAWYAKNDFEAMEGRDFAFQMQPLPEFEFDGVVHCKVLEVDPPRRLVYADRRGTPGNPWFLDTVVSFNLEPADRDGVVGTILHFEQSGFDVTSRLGQIAHPGMSHGWKTILSERLPALLRGGRNGRL